MISIPQLLIESSFCLIVFYAFYLLVLQKETFFQLNRIYLLLTPLLSIIIPLIKIPIQPKFSQQGKILDEIVYPILEERGALEVAVWQSAESMDQWNIADLTFLVYLIGGLFMLFQLFLSLMRLFGQIKKGNIENVGEYKVVTQTNFPASSFFSYVFWNKHDISENAQLIWEHEKVHVKQWHSLDVLLMEFWVILNWFNPLIYYYRKSLRLTHEFIADQYVSEQTGSKYQYALFLANANPSKGKEPAVYTNTFAQFLKNRLTMLARQPSKKWKQSKYFLSVPLFSSLLLLFSFDLVDQLPDPISNAFDRAESLLENVGEHGLPSLGLTQPIEQNKMDNRASEFEQVYESLPMLKNKLIPVERLGDAITNLDQVKEKESIGTIHPLATNVMEVAPKQYSPFDPPKFQVKWANNSCDCRPGQLPNYYHCENKGFDLKAFRSLTKDGGFKLFKNGVEVPYDELQVQSKRAFKMKRKLNQFDFQNVFNPKAKFWKEVEGGDVLKFTFRSGIDDYFHFDVSINQRNEAVDYAYDFYLDDIWVPVDMTSNIGIKYVDSQVFDQISENSKIRFTKNNGALVEVNKIKTSIDYVIGDEVENLSQNTALPKLKSLNYAKTQKRVGFSIFTEDEKKFSIRIVAKKRKDLDIPDLEHLITWGNYKIQAPLASLVVSKEEAMELSKQPILFTFNGQQIPIHSIQQVRALSRKKLQLKSSNAQFGPVEKVQEVPREMDCFIEDYQNDFQCIGEKLEDLEIGDRLSLKNIKTDEGHLFGLSLDIGTPQQVHDFQYFQPYNKKFNYGWSRYVFEKPAQNLGMDAIEHIFSYRTLNGALPVVEIDGTIFEGAKGQEALAKVNPAQISFITFFIKGRNNELNPMMSEVDLSKNAFLRIRLDKNDMIRRLTLNGNQSEQLNEANRILQNIGNSIFVVINGEKKGVIRGDELKELMKRLSSKNIQQLNFIEGKDAINKYGTDAYKGVLEVFYDTEK